MSPTRLEVGRSLAEGREEGCPGLLFLGPAAFCRLVQKSVYELA